MAAGSFYPLLLRRCDMPAPVNLHNSVIAQLPCPFVPGEEGGRREMRPKCGRSFWFTPEGKFDEDTYTVYLQPDSIPVRLVRIHSIWRLQFLNRASA